MKILFIIFLTIFLKSKIKTLYQPNGNSFNVTIGGCTTTQTVDLTTIPRDRRLTGGNGNTGECFYDEFCNGNLLCSRCYSEFGKIEAKVQRWKLGNGKPCSKTAICSTTLPSNGNIQKLGTIKYKAVKTSIFAYIQLMEGVLTIDNLEPAFKARLIGLLNLAKESVKPTNPLVQPKVSNCTPIKWCPETFEVAKDFSFPVEFEDLGIDLATGCRKIKCKGNEETFCIEDFKDLIPVDPDKVIKNIKECQPTMNNGYQLLVWQNEMRTLFPTTYPGSQLDLFLTANKDNKSLNCAKIIYCSSDFSIKDDDIDLIDCDPIDFVVGPPFVMCEPLTTPDVGITKVNCRKSGVNKYDVIPIYPKFYVAKPAPNSEITQIYTNSESTSFSNFIGYNGLDDSFTSAIIEKGSEKEIHQHASLFTFPIEDNFKFLNFDEISEKNSGLIEKTNEYDLYFENETEGWLSNIKSEQLQIQKYKHISDKIEFAGFFKGTLLFNDVIIAESNEVSAFTLALNEKSNIVDLHIVKSIDEKSSRFYSNREGFGLLGVIENKNIIIDNLVINSEISKYIFNISSLGSKICTRYPVNGKLKIEDISIENTLEEQYLLFSGLCDITINNNKVSNLDNNLCLLNLKDITKRVNIKGYNNIDNISNLVVDKSNNVFFGLSFKNSINTLDYNFNSKGLEDIFILKFNTLNNEISYKVYGSIDREVLKEIYPLKNGLLLGGNLEGKTFERRIGDTKFIKLSENIKDAFIAFEDNFIPLRVDDGTRQIKKDNILFSAQIQPNPFNDFIYLKLICSGSCSFNIKLINILGAEVYSEYINTTDGENIFKLNKDNLSAGTYIVEITDSFGKKQTLKAIKN